MTFVTTILAALLAGVNYVLGIYLFILFVHIALNFVRADPSNVIVSFISAITEPPCRFLLRKFPKLLINSRAGAVDLSPMVLMVGIACVRILLDYLHQYLRFGGAAF